MMTLRYDLNRFLKVLFFPTRISLLKGSWQITSRIQQSIVWNIRLAKPNYIPLEITRKKLYEYDGESRKQGMYK